MNISRFVEDSFEMMKVLFHQNQNPCQTNQSHWKWEKTFFFIWNIQCICRCIQSAIIQLKNIIELQNQQTNNNNNKSTLCIISGNTRVNHKFYLKAALFFNIVHKFELAEKWNIYFFFPSFLYQSLKTISKQFNQTIMTSTGKSERFQCETTNLKSIIFSFVLWFCERVIQQKVFC